MAKGKEPKMQTGVVTDPPVPSIPPSVKGRGEEIIEMAHRFVGLFEVKSNADWEGGEPEVESELIKGMKSVGWQSGWAYCMAFVSFIYRSVYGVDCKAIDPLIGVSVLDSFSRVRAAGLRTLEPVPGAVFFMQSGSRWQGHAGIVTKLENGVISTIEANTSPQFDLTASQREGDGIYERTRVLAHFKDLARLHMIGYFNPPD